MKYPLNIFFCNMASWYRQISTYNVAKIQLSETKIHYTEFYRMLGVENEVLALKMVENQRFYG